MASYEAYHVGLFRHLRKFIRCDLVANGFPNPVAGTILNYFDPAKPDYLDHVDTWQKLLCRGVSTARIPFAVCEDDGLCIRSDQWASYEIKSIQQVAKLVYKFHGAPAKETDWEAVKQRLSQPLPFRLKDDEVAGIRDALSGIKPVDLNQAKGRFGPGATSEGFSSFEKWCRQGAIPDVPANLFRCNPRDTWQPRGCNDFRTTKIAEVPKNIKTNRIVSSEPAMSMFAQLALNDDLVEQIHHLFSGHVSLHDQERHNELLSIDGMTTLDLSDASDHISANLVQQVLPQLWPILAKVRSEYSSFPDGDIIRLETFAPMGSGVCFSVMTTVIIGIIIYAFTSWGYNWKIVPWSVYGDDVIVPSWICQYVMDLLSRAGTVINEAKSCTSGLYVESCGRELFRGIDVTPVYIRDPLNELGAETVEYIIGGIYDYFPETAKEIYRLAQPIRGLRWNKDLQECEALVRTHSARAKLRRLDGYAGLNRWFSVGTQQDTSIKQLADGSVHQSERSVDIHAENPNGVACEVWTKLTWRYRSVSNYPNLMFMGGSHAILVQEDKQASTKDRQRRKSRKSPKQSTDHQNQNANNPG